MPENPQKPAFQRIEKYDLAYLADLVCDSDVERIGEALVDAEQAGAKAERERIHQDIAEMQNPYPKDVFISEKYDSWRQAWDICHKKVMELI